jgi:TRAP-type C4-dicarboxylate transport system permease small subunit
MWLVKASDAIYKVMTPTVKVLVCVGGGCLVAMMFLTASDVALRYFFNKPISGAFDLTEYMMAIVFAFGLPYCAVHKGHIKVEILIDRIPKKAQAIINGIILIISLGLFSLISWQSLLYGKIQFDTSIVSSVLLIPRYPFVGLLFFGWAGFVVVLLADFLKILSVRARK